MVAFGLCGRLAAVWKSGESPGNEEPCLLIRRAGFSKIDDLLDRELPACLLGMVFVCGTRLRDAEPGSGFANTQEHTRATQPCGCLRVP